MHRQFCRLLCEELTFKMYLKFVFSVFIGSSGKCSFWFLDLSKLILCLTGFVNLFLPVKLRGSLCILSGVWRHSRDNRYYSGEQQQGNPTLHCSLHFPRFSYLFIFISISLVLLVDFPLVTNEEISALPTVNVLPGGKYSGAKLKSVIRMVRGLLEQGVPSKEIEVSICPLKSFFSSMKQLEIEWLVHHCLKYHSSLI